MVEPDRDQQITLVIENHGLSRVKLKKNPLLGQILPADPVDTMEAVCAMENVDSIVAAMRPDPSQVKQLLNTISLI